MTSKIVSFQEAQDMLVQLDSFFSEKKSLIQAQHGDDYAQRVSRCVNALLDVCEHTYEQKRLETYKEGQ